MRVLILLLILLGAWTSVAHGSPARDQMMKSLRGLTGVDLMVELDQSTEEWVGRPDSAIAADLEVKLHEGGVVVFTAEERRAIPWSPILTVAINVTDMSSVLETLKPELRPRLVTGSVELLQGVTLERDQSVRCLESTWSFPITIVLKEDNAAAIPVYLDLVVGTFIADYLKANGQARSLSE